MSLWLQSARWAFDDGDPPLHHRVPTTALGTIEIGKSLTLPCHQHRHSLRVGSRRMERGAVSISPDERLVQDDVLLAVLVQVNQPDVFLDVG